MPDVIGSATRGVSVNVVLDPIALNVLLNTPSGVVGRFITSVATIAVAYAKSIAPVRISRSSEEASRSGVLRSSIGIISVKPTLQGIQVKIAVNVKYALAVHYGTRARVIRPKRKKLLRYPTSGGVIRYSKSVNSPGNSPNPFFWDAMIRSLILDPRVTILSATFDSGSPL